MKVIADARVKSGKLTFKQRSVFLDDVSKLKDGDYVVTVERRKKRSDLQNRYIHALFTIFKDALNELGNDFSMEEVKEMMKYKFLRVEIINEKTGEVIGTRIRHTSELKTYELNDFYEKIIMYAADEFGIILPYPNEQLTII